MTSFIYFPFSMVSRFLKSLFCCNFSFHHYYALCHCAVVTVMPVNCLHLFFMNVQMLIMLRRHHAPHTTYIYILLSLCVFKMQLYCCGGFAVPVESSLFRVGSDMFIKWLLLYLFRWTINKANIIKLNKSNEAVKRI